MKKIYLIITIITTLFILTACSSEKIETDALKFKKEYEELNNQKQEDKNIRSLSISEKNPFVYKTDEEIVKMIDSGETFVVYFGFASCPWCRSVIEELIKAANNLKIDKIYYVDVKQIRDKLEINENGEVITVKKGSKGYYKLLKKLNIILDDYELDDKNIKSNEKRIYAPSVITVVEGEPMVLETGIPDSLKDPYSEIDDETKKKIYNKFKCTLKCVLEESITCNKKNSC